jgi:hypothetical protein
MLADVGRHFRIAPFGAPFGEAPGGKVRGFISQADRMLRPQAAGTVTRRSPKPTSHVGEG